MSKVSNSTPDAPRYSGSKVSLGGSNAYSGILNGMHVADYKMSDADSKIYDYALNTIAQILPNINTFEPQTLSNLEDSVNAYRESGINDINDFYNNSLNNIKNDIVSRFGNLDNSMFGQNLNELEKSRANSISNFAQSVLARQNELMNNELNQRYALINLLSGLSNNIYTKALNTLGFALNGSSNLNSFNNNLYNVAAHNNNNSSNSLINPDLLNTAMAVFPYFL